MLLNSHLLGDSQALAATETAGLQDSATGSGLHAGTETMNLGPLAFFGLVSSEHGYYFLSLLCARGLGVAVECRSPHGWLSLPSYLNRLQQPNRPQAGIP